MIVVGTCFLSVSIAAAAAAAMDRHSAALGGRIVLAGVGAPLSTEGSTSRLAVGR